MSVITSRTGWEDAKYWMENDGQGIWETFIPGVSEGDIYRYIVEGADGFCRYKSDPYAFRSELRPQNASVVCSLYGYDWQDQAYYENQDQRSVVERPMAIYEVHLGSWKKRAERNLEEDPDGFLNYRELADLLGDYVVGMGYTHVELIGISEYPLDMSWGYQVTGYYSPTSRYGTPDDFRYFVDQMHRRGISVILDWVPAHFPKDAFGLECFDGTPLYEYADPLRAEYPEWGTKAFDHGKPEVKSFLLSNLFYWIREFHIDAFRVDAVAAMLYNNFSRSEWRPNIYGGSENLESREFFRHANSILQKESSAYLIAEDSSALPGITTSPEDGGFGFTFKWNMGWMNDTLRYVEQDPIYRRWHHGELTHTVEYAFSENYILVLSHDEVVHCKKSMLQKVPGDIGAKFGGLKTLYTYMFTYPGKKLLFMGQEFGEESEWSEKREINWALTEDSGHRDVQDTVRALLAIYKTYPSLYADSKNPATFEWVNSQDCFRNIFSYIRRNPWNYDGAVLVVCNFSPVGYDGYTCGVPFGGWYKRLFSTYDQLPGGGGPKEQGDIAPLNAEQHDCDGRPFMITYNLRPYESVIFAFPSA